MVEFLFTVGSFGVLYQRQKDAVRRCRDGDGQRWGLLRSRLSVAFGGQQRKGSAGGETATGRFDRWPVLSASLIAIFAATMVSISRGEDARVVNQPVDDQQVVDTREDKTLTLEPPVVEPPVVADSAGAIPAPLSHSEAHLSVSEAQARASIQWLATLALRKLPRSFDGDKDWGETKKLWAGIKVRRDGLKLKTHRRFREVEQGRWVKYQVMLPDPTAPNAATVAIHDVVPTIDQASGEQRWKIHSSIVAPMKFTARIQRWNLGVKLFSMTITGDLRVRLISTTSIGFVADYAEIPPALVIDPQMDQAQLVLERFEVNRISRVGGDVAEQWGELIEEILVERFVKKYNDRLVGKLNTSIEKERDDLRLSMAEWFTNW